MEFISRNWLAIVSLLVALIGGVPGIIAIINQRRNRPVFRFSLVNIITGHVLHSPSGNTHTMILITGTASNEGNSILSPACFELECKTDGNWLRLEKKLIPEDATFESDAQDIKLASAWRKDLQRFSGTITTGMPLNGHLMFVSSNVPLDKIRDNPNLKLKLICRDIFGKDHKTPIELHLHRISTDTTHPKHGLTITSKI
ncbi:MAG TPA: hypothetical protein PLR20_15870 [Syntrophales bacterium]|nr:hypothetical protein [Syntrophales bacterium]